MTYTFHGVVGALFLALGSSLQANLITERVISGGSNFLHAEFDLVWDPLAKAAGGNGFEQETVAGTWPGGGLSQWQFTASVASSPLFPLQREGFDRYVLRTTWNDGWTPFPILVESTFVFGLGDGSSLILYSPNPTNYLYTDHNGLTYYFTATATGIRNTADDTSGKAHIIFDLSRSPIPEPGSGILLLGSALGLAVFARCFRRGPKVS